jgi:hypothetical protein
MEVSGELHAPAVLPPRKVPPVHIEREAVRTPDVMEKNKNLFSLPEVEP